MIADRASGREGHSTLTGTKIDLTVDLDSLPHIMNVLTDLYEDTQTALLREYTTNGTDAHLAAGIDAPVEVELPGPLSPYLRVRDRGTGLSMDDLREIYSKYGASTKRGSNDQQGMLGLGCKAALTYTDQFTLTAVKDGWRAEVAVSRNEGGTGTLTVVAHEPTTDPNGVEVTIPVRSENEFAAKAAALFKWHRPGTDPAVLVNGSPPARFEGERVTDDYWLTKPARTTNYSGAAYAEPRWVVVQGGVPYPADALAKTDTGRKLAERLPEDTGLAAFVPVGSVYFLPSREALADDPHTRATLDRIAREVIAELEAAAKAAVAGADTAPAALAARNEWARYLSPTATGAQGGLSWSYRSRRGYAPTWRGEDAGIEWGGVRVPATYTPGPGKARDGSAVRADGTLVPNTRQTRYGNDHTTSPFRGTGECSGASELHSSLWPGTVFVTGFNNTTFSAGMRRKLDAWHDARPDDAQPVERYYLTTDESLPSAVQFWTDPSMVVPWADVLKSDRAALATGAPAPPSESWADKYTCWRMIGGYLSNRTITAAELKAHDGPVYYEAEGKYGGHRHARYLTERDPDAVIATFGANREAKFRRLFPNAREATEAVKADAAAWRKRISPKVREALGMGAERELLRQLDPDRIDDPELARQARVARADTSGVAARQVLLSRAGQYVEWPRVKPSALADYPLMAALGYRGTLPKSDDVYLYLNCAHAARNETES